MDILNNETNKRENSTSHVQLSAIRVTGISLLLFISLVGILANGVIFHKLLSRNNLRVCEYLILNLAITDMATCAVSIPFDLAERFVGGFPFGEILCFLVYPLQTVLMAVSVITLLSMSLERRRIVMKTMRPRILPRTIKIAICVSWIAPTVITIPYAFVLKLDGAQCMEKWSEKWHVKVFTLTNFTIFFVIPIVVIATSYFLAERKLQMELQKLDDMMEGNERSRSNYIKKRTIQKLQVTKIFITAVVAFFICMLPTHLVWIWHDFAQGKNYKYFTDILIFANILMYSNSALNPFIFKSVRGRLITRWVACCCKAVSENGSSTWLSRLCVDLPQDTNLDMEREGAIRTRQSYVTDSHAVYSCDGGNLLYETNVWILILSAVSIP